MAGNASRVGRLEPSHTGRCGGADSLRGPARPGRGGRCLAVRGVAAPQAARRPCRGQLTSARSAGTSGTPRTTAWPFSSACASRPARGWQPQDDHRPAGRPIRRIPICIGIERLYLLLLRFASCNRFAVSYASTIRSPLLTGSLYPHCMIYRRSYEPGARSDPARCCPKLGRTCTITVILPPLFSPELGSEWPAWADGIPLRQYWHERARRLARR